MSREDLVSILKRIERRLERIERTMYEILYDFRGMKIAFDKTFGRWGAIVGRIMEIVFTKVFETISKKGGARINGIEIPPLENIKKLEKPGEYEFEISGIDPQGKQWLIDVKYRFVFKSDAKKSLNSIKRWLRNSKNRKFVFCLIALIGLEEGIREYLENEIKKLGGETLIIDPSKARKLLELFSETKIPVYEFELETDQQK